MTEFAVIGAGWRAAFFLDIASALDDMHVSGVVTRDPARAAEIEAKWQLPCFQDVDALLAKSRPAFVVASVSADAMSEVCLDIAGRGVPVLLETPPATSLEQLCELHQKIRELDGRVQVAEQYWAQPLHSARQAIVERGSGRTLRGTD